MNTMLQLALLQCSLLVALTSAQLIGDLRLLAPNGGNQTNGFAAGRLEIYVRSEWGTICNRHSLFGSTEANVACKQLGYKQYRDYGTISTKQYTPVSDFVPIWLSGNIDCHLSDKTLLACDHDPIGTGVTFCSHSNDIWLNCSSCNKFLCDEGTCVTACDGTKDCAGGEDEDNIACTIVGGLSNIIKIVIAVVIVVIILCIVIPVISCIIGCYRCGAACFRKPPGVTSSTYHPMGGVHDHHHSVHEYHDEV